MTYERIGVTGYGFVVQLNKKEYADGGSLVLFLIGLISEFFW